MYEPPPSLQTSVLSFIDEVPPAFFRLSAMAERIHADLGVAGPQRSVLRSLFIEGEQTTPDLARRKPVTRQAIQPVVDDLVARGLVSARENPRHRRSKLYALTKPGIDLCVAIQQRELEEINRLAPAIGSAAFGAAIEAIRTLNNALADRLDIPR